MVNESISEETWAWFWDIATYVKLKWFIERDFKVVCFLFVLYFFIFSQMFAWLLSFLIHNFWVCFNSFKRGLWVQGEVVAMKESAILTNAWQGYFCLLISIWVHFDVDEYNIWLSVEEYEIKATKRSCMKSVCSFMLCYKDNVDNVSCQ